MSNTIDISRPSYLGIPQCINETVSITNDLAQCVGTDARWLSAVRRSMTGEVAGECYKTDAPLPETVNMIKHGQLMQARLTAEEVTADRVGRAVTQYRYRLMQGVPYLPQKDKLVCLYVPRWQDEQSNVLYDLSGNGNDYSGAMTWHTDGIEQSGRWAATALHNAFTSDNITTILDRDINPDAPQGPGVSGAFGLGLIYSGSSTTYIHEAYYNYEKYARAGMRDVRLSTDFDSDGWSVMRQTGTAAEYNGETYSVASNRRITHVRYNRVAGAMYKRLRVIAVWSVSLTDIEIQVAQMYLAQQSRPADL